VVIYGAFSERPLHELAQRMALGLELWLVLKRWRREERDP
jgi:hypothetical protein